MKLNKTRHIRALVGAAAAAFVLIKETNLTSTLNQEVKHTADQFLLNSDIMFEQILNRQKISNADITWCTSLIDTFDKDVEALKSGIYNYPILVLYAKMQLNAALKLSKPPEEAWISGLVRLVTTLVRLTVGSVDVGDINYDVAFYLAKKYYKLMEKHHV